MKLAYRTPPLAASGVGVLAALFAASVSHAFDFIINSSTNLPIKWPAGTVALRIMADNTTALPGDGTTRAATIVAAAQAWNGSLGAAQFAPQIASAGSAGSANALNEVVFAPTIFGSAFDANTLAVTLSRSNGNAMVETDVIFNASRTWDSYRGTQAGHGGAVDIRRVAIHEFGHVLGLDHPDQAVPQQAVSAVMNSIITDVDALTSDDIAGAQRLYGPPGVPANNHFSNAIAIPIVSGSTKLTGYNTNATKEAGEPLHAADTGGRSVWWKWTAPAASHVTLVTQGSIFDTTLGVYTGSAVSALTTVASSDDLQPGVVQYSTLSFSATSGTTYFFAVDGFAGDSGFIELTLTVIPAPVITAQPVSQTVTAGQSATFSVAATATSTRTYQWRRNGVAVSGATNASYTINPTTRTDADFYDVVVTASAVSTTSATVRLVVAPTSYPTSVGADPAFSVKLEAGGATVNALAALADGRVLVGGDFVRINGHATSGVARFAANGTIDSTFVAPFFDGPVRAIAVQGDGKILVGGGFVRVGEHDRVGVVRLNADGSLDPGFRLVDANGNPVLLPDVLALAIAGDGKFVVCGYGPVVRFKADGTIDTTFSSAALGDGPKLALAFATDGKIFVGGFFGILGPPGLAYITRLNTDGGVDTTFAATGLTGLVISIVPLNDGKVFVGGGFLSSDGATFQDGFRRLNVNGTRDTTFAPASIVGIVNDRALALALDGNGKLYVATTVGIARFDSSGTFEAQWPGSTLSIGNPGTPIALLPRADGGLWVGGSFSKIGTVDLETIGRFAPGSMVATPVGTVVNRRGVVESMVLDSAGRLLIGGEFRRVGATAASNLARLNANGTVDTTFDVGTGPNGPVKRLVRLADGKIIAMGASVVRRLVNGALDVGFNYPAADFYSAIRGVVAAPGGKLLLSGRFLATDSPSAWPMLRLDGDGSLDSAFQAGAVTEFAIVTSAVVQSDARIIATGGFKTFNGATQNRIVRLAPQGAVDATFAVGTGFDATVQEYTNDISLVQLTAGNRIAVAGNFTTFNGSSVPPLVKLTSNGSLDATFAVPTGVFSQPVKGMLVQEDEKVLAWIGPDSWPSATAPPRLVRVAANGQLDLSFQHVGLRNTDHITTLVMGDAGQLYYSLYNRGEVYRTITVNAAPAILSPPTAQSVNAGATATFSVTATGNPAPAFRWRRNGVPLTGATAATLTLTNVQPADAGLYSVSVANVVGSVVSTAVALTVNLPASAPAITTQPANQLVNAGGAVTFSMSVSGAGPFSYQWRKNGVAIASATAAELTLTGVQPADTGAYSVVITNASGSVTSRDVTLSVIPAGFGATHAVVGSGYVAGRPVQITTTLTYGSPLAGLLYQVLLPPDWSYLSGGGAEGETKPPVGTVDLAEWAWATVPASSVTFTYTLGVPAGTTGEQLLTGLVTTQPGPILFTAKLDPLRINPAVTHSADTDRDFEISLFELTRVIELYNTRNGTVRSGAYRVDSAGEDGFAADAPRAAGSSAALARYHSADTRGATTGTASDGAIDLFELTRVIELYNTRAGTVRTGRYHVVSGTEDGFAAGP